MRIKSRALNLLAEDYFNDKVLRIPTSLYAGTCALPDNFWEKHDKDGVEEGEQDLHQRRTGPPCPQFLINEFVSLESDGFAALSSGKPPADRRAGNPGRLYPPQECRMGITARNREQNFRLNPLMNPDIDFVTLSARPAPARSLLTPAPA